MRIGRISIAVMHPHRALTPKVTWATAAASCHSFQCTLATMSNRLNFIQMSSCATTATANCGPIWIPKAGREENNGGEINHCSLWFPRAVWYKPVCLQRNSKKKWCLIAPIALEPNIIKEELLNQPMKFSVERPVSQDVMDPDGQQALRFHRKYAEKAAQSAIHGERGNRCIDGLLYMPAVWKTRPFGRFGRSSRFWCKQLFFQEL